MSYGDKRMLRDKDGKLIPQYYDPIADEFKPLHGRDGAMFVNTGLFVRQSADPFPEGKEGDSLYLWDTKQVFLHDGTTWREL